MQNFKEKTLSQRIAERIIKYILEENLQPGDKLPNETVMCERLMLEEALCVKLCEHSHHVM